MTLTAWTARPITIACSVVVCRRVRENTTSRSTTFHIPLRHGTMKTRKMSQHCNNEIRTRPEFRYIQVERQQQLQQPRVLHHGWFQLKIQVISYVNIRIRHSTAHIMHYCVLFLKQIVLSFDLLLLKCLIIENDSAIFGEQRLVHLFILTSNITFIVSSAKAVTF